MSGINSHGLAPGIVYWITGLSGAGKSENARRLVNFLRRSGRPCVLLDGDELRAAINVQKCFTRADRVQLGLQYGNLCKLISSQGVDVVIATIALYSEIHNWKNKNLPNCCTVFLEVPIEELKSRDPKKIYARYYAKELSNVAGLDLTVEYPDKPEIHIRWQQGMDADVVWEMIENKIPEFMENFDNLGD